MTVETQIIEAIINYLKGITTVNGYSFDCDDRVFYWRGTPLESAETHMIDVRDYSIEPVDGMENHHALLISITYELRGKTSAADIRQRKQDIITAFSQIEGEAFVAGAMFVGSEKIVEQDQSRITGEEMLFAVEYFAERWTI